MKKFINILMLLVFLTVSAAQATTNPPPFFNLAPGSRIGVPHIPTFSAPHPASSATSYYSDDANTKPYYFDDANTKPYVISGGNQPSLDGNFDDSVVDMTQSYVTGGTTSTPTVQLTSRRTTNGTFTPLPGLWGIYNARLDNMLGKTPTVNVPTIGNYFGFLANNGFYSCTLNATDWHIWDNASISSGSGHFSNNSAFTCNTVYVSYLPVFSNPQIKQWLSDNEASGYLHQTPSAVTYAHQKYQIGTTTLGYPIYAVRISDDSASPSLGVSKKRIAITGGTHPSEVNGSWNVKGLADFIVSSDPVAINLRKECEFWLVFDTTPESRAKGKQRYTFTEDVDPNRNIPGTGSGNEVNIVTTALQSDWGATGPIDGGIDFHGGVLTLYQGYFQDNEPYRTAFYDTLTSYTGATHDYGGFIDETMAGFFGKVMGAKYYESLEQGMTAITSITDMTSFGEFTARTFNDLLATAIDDLPNSFDFTDQTGVATNTLITSNIVQVTGFGPPIGISISGAGSPEYRICSDGACSTVTTDWTNVQGALVSGQYVQLELTSNANISTANVATLVTGSGGANWSVTTTASAPAPPGTPFAWYDFSDTGSITASGGSVTAVNDKSGNGFNATSSSTFEPISGTRTINGLNALDFDGTDDSLVLPSGLYGISAGDNTVYVVYQADTLTGTEKYLISGSTSTTSRWNLKVRASSTDNIGCRNSSGTSNLLVAYTQNTTNPHIAEMDRSGTALNCQYDATTGSNTTGTDITLTNLRLGILGSGTTSPYDGRIGEVVIYNYQQGSTEKANTISYLKAKWGTP